MQCSLLNHVYASPEFSCISGFKLHAARVPKPSFQKVLHAESARLGHLFPFAARKMLRLLTGAANRVLRNRKCACGIYCEQPGTSIIFRMVVTVLCVRKTLRIYIFATQVLFASAISVLSRISNPYTVSNQPQIHVYHISIC